MSEKPKEYKIDGRPSTIYRVVKNKNNPYVMIDRRPVDNPKLSFKAKGILVYLLSRPDGWEVSVADLIKHGTDGEAAVRSGLKELKEAGHMRYTQSRNAGRITGWLIEVFEVPSPDCDFQEVEKQHVENQRQLINIKNRKSQKAATPRETKPSKPKANDYPELVMYKSIVKRYPAEANWSDVIASIQKAAARLGKEVLDIREELFLIYRKWTSKGYNPFNLAWLEWAETGTIPQNGIWRPQNANYQTNTGAEPHYTEDDKRAAELIRQRRLRSAMS